MKTRYLLTLPALFLLAQTAAAQPAQQSRPQTCEGCHAEAHDEFIPLADGTLLGVWVDPQALADSVHGNELTCTDCHRQIGDYPHAPSAYDNRKDLRSTLSQTCNRCHYGHTKEFRDSTHFQQLEAGNFDAPTCVDCHGSHDMQAPASPRAAISDRCGRCHEDVQQEFQGSVHAAAEQAHAEDLPVCTDCHGAHEIKDPTSLSFQAGEHDICAKCHSDTEIMGRHDLNPDVLSTYLDDFHGASNRLYGQTGVNPDRPVATCSDCHGVHSIRSMADRTEVADMAGRTELMCTQCHEGASDDFAAAWLSHAKPTMTSAPLAWGIQWIYRLLIPVIMLGLVLHIIMDLVQVRTHKRGSA